MFRAEIKEGPHSAGPPGWAETPGLSRRRQATSLCRGAPLTLGAGSSNAFCQEALRVSFAKAFAFPSALKIHLNRGHAAGPLGLTSPSEGAGGDEPGRQAGSPPPRGGLLVRLLPVWSSPGDTALEDLLDHCPLCPSSWGSCVNARAHACWVPASRCRAAFGELWELWESHILVGTFLRNYGVTK